MLSVSQRYFMVARSGSYIDLTSRLLNKSTFLGFIECLDWDKVPHVEICHHAHCLSMEAIIAERQLRWTGHVIRMPENRLPRRVLYGELKGRRSAGGQYKRFKDLSDFKDLSRFKDCLKATLKNNVIPLDQLETLAADRKSWRNIYTTGILSRQAMQDKTEDERRHQRHEHAVRNRENNAAYLCPTCGRTCLSRIGLYSHEQSHL